MQGKSVVPSLDLLRAAYYGEAEQAGKGSRSALAPLPELTASARHVVREARRRLGESASLNRAQIDEEVIFGLVERLEEEEGTVLSNGERHAAVAALVNGLDDFGILRPLLEREDVNDIIVTSWKDVAIQVGRANYQTDVRFSDPESYQSFVENLLKQVGKACTNATPVVDAAWGPDVRLCVTHESFSPPGKGPMLTIRVARHRSLSLETMSADDMAPMAVLAYLRAIVSQGAGTVVIAGEVGTGKTTLVRALMACVPPQESILTIEDTHELAVDRPFLRTLLTREPNTEGAGRISPARGIRTGMRMAMNRLILGETRDAEAAEAFIDVCASGHSGMTTIHSRSARDALARFELFLGRVQGGVGIDTIRRQIANAIDVVVHLSVDRIDGRRRVAEVIEVLGAAEGVIQVAPVFRRLPDTLPARWVRESGISRFADLCERQGVLLPSRGAPFGAIEGDYDSAR